MGGKGSSIPERAPRQTRSIRFDINTDLAIKQASKQHGVSIQQYVHDAVILRLALTEGMTPQ